jgi:hypothetical protein
VTSFAPSCPAAFEVVVRYQGSGDVVLVVLLALRWIGNLVAADEYGRIARLAAAMAGDLVAAVDA